MIHNIHSKVYIKYIFKFVNYSFVSFDLNYIYVTSEYIERAISERVG